MYTNVATICARCEIWNVSKCELHESVKSSYVSEIRNSEIFDMTKVGKCGQIVASKCELNVCSI